MTAETASEVEDETTSDAATSDAGGNESEAEDEYKMNLSIDIQSAGACKRHVRITVPRADIDHYREEALKELDDKAEVPGFRPGKAPRALIEKRFKEEVTAQVKQKVLLQSLSQMHDSDDLDPIDEPDIAVDALDIPEEGDFEFEFDVEVRPQFDLPDYKGLEIERPKSETTEADVDAYLSRFLQQYAELQEKSGPAEPQDIVTLSAEFRHDGKVIHKLDEINAQLKKRLRFRDAEIEGFDQLMSGAKAGDSIDTTITVSTGAPSIEMRGEEVAVKFHVRKVNTLQEPELNARFLERIDVESVEELREEVESILKRQADYHQRQAVRKQVMEKITESADWELPEQLLLRQVDNAMNREILEMQQAGFTRLDLMKRENELRQRATQTAEENLKQHFILDQIAEEEKIDVDPSEIDMEIQMMALQRGESPRRLRARLTKSGVIENLEAQIRERKAVDLILEHANFTEIDAPNNDEEDAETDAVNASVCGMATVVAEDDETEEE